MQGKTRIGVIGAGISGMTCAYRLQAELKNVDITIVSEDFSPNLTSDGAAGIWEPYDNYNTDADKIKKWSTETYSYLKKLALSPASIQAGVSPLSIKCLLPSSTEGKLPDYMLGVEHLRIFSSEEVKSYGPNCEYGYQYTTFTCEPRIYVPWLMKKFVRNGGRVVRRKVTDLSEFCRDFDLVINCTGLGSKSMIKDTSMTPVRGQLIKMKGVDVINATVFDAGQAFVIPGRDLITIGGTFEWGEGKHQIDEKEKQRQLDICSRWVPGLKDAEVVFDWCGFRPARKEGIRVEIDNSWHPTTKVVHNYGHGGIGITVSWGCATDVVSLARNALRLSVPSKL